MHTHPIGETIADDSRLDGRILDMVVFEHDGLWTISDLSKLWATQQRSRTASSPPAPSPN